MARKFDEHLSEWVEAKIETWMGLELNREKTKEIDLKQPVKRFVPSTPTFSGGCIDS